MKVFVSSVIGGMGEQRAAAVQGIHDLGMEAVTAEKFGALPATPQIACLDALRRSNVVVLILGAIYGARQASGISATHEEYREARGTKPILMFVDEGATADPDQEEFLREVQGWEGGLFRAGYRSVSDLRSAVVKALSQHQVANAIAPIDTAEMLARALTAFPGRQRGQSSQHGYGALLEIAVAGGPAQTILRPAQIEAPAFTEKLQIEATFGPRRLFDRKLGVGDAIEDGALVIKQGSRSIRVDEQGTVFISMPLESGDHGMTIAETDVRASLATALSYASWCLNQIDPTQGLSQIAVAAGIAGGEHSTWQSDEAHTRSSRTSMSFGGQNRTPVHLRTPSRPRAALEMDAAGIIDDLVTLLRRQWQK